MTKESIDSTIGKNLLQRALRRLTTAWDRTVRHPLTRFFEDILFRQHTERLYFVLGGHIFFQTLRSAVKLNLFSLLSEHGRLIRTQIAHHLGIEQQPARILLLGLTSVGLLRKRGEKAQ